MSLYLGTDLVAGNQDVSNFVEKTGDTMTGALNIEDSLKLVNPNVVKGTNPTSSKYTSIEFNDSTNDADFTKTRLGIVYNMIDTSGTSNTIIAANRFVASNADSAQIVVTEKADGTKSCSFPDTVRCDGQYVEASSTVASGVSLNGSTNLSYTLSDVPNDGKNHMVCLIATVTTGTTSGNNIMAQITSTLCPGGMNVSRAITRTSSNMSGTGTCWIPVGTDRKITLNRSTSYNGTCNLYMRGYRRIGDNS